MGVQFEDNQIARTYASERPPKLAGWLINKGLAKDVAGANRLQVVVAIVFFAVAIYLIL